MGVGYFFPAKESAFHSLIVSSMGIVYGWTDNFDGEPKFVSPERIQPTRLTNGRQSKIVKWLWEMGDKLHLSIETLLIAVDMVKRAPNDVLAPHAQIVLRTCACLWIASKHEERYPLESHNFKSLSFFSINQLCSDEVQVLKTIGYRVWTPTVICYVQPVIGKERLMEYMIYLSVWCSGFNKFLPSVIGQTITEVCQQRRRITHKDCCAVYKEMTEKESQWPAHKELIQHLNPPWEAWLDRLRVRID